MNIKTLEHKVEILRKLPRPPDNITLGKRGTYCQGYLGFAKMYLELLELLLQLLLELLLQLLLLLLFSLPGTW